MQYLLPPHPVPFPILTLSHENCKRKATYELQSVTSSVIFHLPSILPPYPSPSSRFSLLRPQTMSCYVTPDMAIWNPWRDSAIVISPSLSPSAIMTIEIWRFYVISTLFCANILLIKQKMLYNREKIIYFFAWIKNKHYLCIWVDICHFHHAWHYHSGATTKNCWQIP